MNNVSSAVLSAITRFNAGDPAALNDVFARTAGHLERLARRMLRHGFARLSAHEQTADIVQEASLRLLRAMREVRVNTPLEFFRLNAGMVRRALLDLARHHFGPEGSAAHRAEVVADSTVAYDPSAGPSHDPVELAAWGEFHGCVEALPIDLRDVFDLLWYDDLSQDEAAALLGMSVPTVKRRWRDAKLALIDRLGGGLPGGEIL